MDSNFPPALTYKLVKFLLHFSTPLTANEYMLSLIHFTLLKTFVNNTPTYARLILILYLQIFH